MYTVSNRIKVKKGYAHKMAPAFTKPGALQEFKGFHKVDVWISTQFEDYDEMAVVTYWETLEDFYAWRDSDAFKKAHSKREGEENTESPVLGNQAVIAEIVSTLSK